MTRELLSAAACNSARLRGFERGPRFTRLLLCIFAQAKSYSLKSVLFFFFLFSFRVQAQTPFPEPGAPSGGEPQTPAGVSRTEAVYLLPQTIFVGDPGRLVVPLGQAFAGTAPFVLTDPGELPESPDLTFLRIELERREGSSRLLIDFIPYAPGLVSFPPLSFNVRGTDGQYREEPLTITGLKAQVASILTPSQMALSEAASPLAVPGTSFLVYGTFALILFLLFVGTGSSLWGRRYFGEIVERLRKRHLLRAMTRFLRRLGQEKDVGKNGRAGQYLALLSKEFREFLSLFTGVNCRSLAAGEFLDLPLVYAVRDDSDQSNLAEAEGDTARGDITQSAAARNDDVPSGFTPSGARQGGTVGDTATAGLTENAARNNSAGTEAAVRPGVPVSSDESPLNPAFLYRLFQTWDTLRFSGRSVDKIDLFYALKKTEFFIAALDRVERKKSLLRRHLLRRRIRAGREPPPGDGNNGF